MTLDAVKEFKMFKKLKSLRGLKAHYIPWEIIDGHYKQNPEHEEVVILLEYCYSKDLPFELREAILFIREDCTLGRDRLDAFKVIL